MEVSVITPTYNRRRFIPSLIRIYELQTYQKDKMEWIILDDGRDKVEDLFQEAAKRIPNIRYIYSDEKLRIGAKRNLLNTEARGQIIISMDDDDYYPSNKVEEVVRAFNKYPTIELAGSSEMYMFYTDTKKIYTIGPYHEKHTTNGTMSYKRSYLKGHAYDEYVTKAEEVSFLDNYKNKMIQINPMHAILVICHSDNTVDKTAIRDKQLLSTVKNPSYIKETAFVLEDIVTDSAVRDFYTALT
jgi:glycosyltransferase involved in cell wall biosynthesis